jgi:FG-GAP-like repeat
MQRLIKVTLFCLVLSSPLLASEFLFGDTLQTIIPGDYNGDGASDILWRDISGNVAMWLMDGLSITSGSTIANIWTGWTIVGSGDFNGNGKADILWRDTACSVVIWLMDGPSVTSFSTIANITAAQFSGKVTSIAVDPSRSATVYAAPIGSGTYKTSDGGQSWIPSSTGLPKDILTLALDPANPGIVYAGTSIGVFKSVNAGVSWNTAGSDLLSAPIRALAIDPLHPGDDLRSDGAWRRL